MKAKVITIMNEPRSVESAERCIKSGMSYGLDIEIHKAITPEDNPIQIAEDLNIQTTKFKNEFSKFERCLSAFLSHRSCWQEAYETRSPMVIFEHDAVMIDFLPNVFKGLVVNVGKPSYGKWINPQFLGEGNLVTKRYFPGAHAYYVSPAGAFALLEKSYDEAEPTDIFMNLDRFPFLTEVYPFKAEAKDSFTTIQVERGCIAKHRYSADYDII